jgi:ribonuclease Z
MPATFLPRLVNGKFEDPGLYIPFRYENRAVIFDLGNIDALSPRDILKITHCFITHAHMDHFIGFDTLLRLMLGRNKKLCLFGPDGFLNRVEGKLSGYEWNLVDNFKDSLVIEATEVKKDSLRTRQYHCRNKFIIAEGDIQKPFTGKLLDEPSFSVSAVILDHGIDCLGFALKERFHVNVKKTAVYDMGLDIGPWLKDFKKALFERKPMDSIFEVNCSGREKFLLGELAEKIAAITPGQKFTYITDTVCSIENVEKIIDFAKHSDRLFIEAAFLESEKETAKEKRHLTARCAGEIARKAGARNITLFHFSPRYQGREQQIEEEAMDAYMSQ